MKFRSERDNPLPDLVELKTEIAPQEGNEAAHQVLVELRVHPHEIEESFGTIAVEISEAVLSVMFSGLDVVPHTKLGNPVVPTKAQKEVQHEHTVTNTSGQDRSTSGGIGAGASVTGPTGKIDYSRSTTHKTALVINDRKTTSDVIEHHHVRAIGNDNWRISAPPEHSLDGVYIDHQPLCHVTPIAGRNRIGVETELIVKQRHLKARFVGDESWIDSMLSTNQKKIRQVLINKSLHSSASDHPFKGIFVFAKAQSFDEG